MDKYTHLVKKSIIPVLLVFLGIYLLIAGFGNIKNYNEAQYSHNDSNFLYGAIASLLMGIFILIINFELVNSKIIKKITLPISLIILLPFAGHLSYSIYNSIDLTIQEIDQKKQYDDFIQQGLIDIKDIQSEYKKIYGWYSDDYNELKRFLLEDKAKLISLAVPQGLNEDSIYNLLDMKITPAHQLILKYDSTDINDWKKITDGYSDDEALKCKLLVRDTVETDILKKLFPEEQEEKNRVYPFDIENFQNVSTFDFHSSKNNQFSLKTDIYDKIGSLKYFFLYYNKNEKKITSSHLINSNKKFNHLYGKEGLVLIQDSLLGDKKITTGDVLISINDIQPKSPSDIKDILSTATMKDTVRMELVRYSKSKNPKVVSTFNLDVVFSSLSISRTQNMNYWINDLETSFATTFYNPKDYIVIPVETKFLKNAEEATDNHPLKNGMFLDTSSLKKLTEYRALFNDVKFEYEKGKYHSSNDATIEPVFIYVKTKIGTPVFLAEDPNPYDPFSQCPTAWKIGSLKEIKTNGNWD